MKSLKVFCGIGVFLLLWGGLTVEKQPMYGAVVALVGILLAAPYIVVCNMKGEYNDPTDRDRDI